MTDIKYVAFDVHKSTISIAVVNLDGKLVTQAVIQTDANAVRDFLRGLSGQVHLTFEEGTHSQWMYELTHSLVARVAVCNARHSSSPANKSDKLDALRLAQLLRAGLLKAVYHGSASTQTLKQLVHCYDSLTEDTRRNRCEWIGKLTEEGLRLRAEVLYKQLDHLRPLRRDARKAMIAEAQKQKAFKRLCTVPGLGPVRVAQIISAVGSPDRFIGRRQFWAYCGFAVVTRSSADYEVRDDLLQRRRAKARTRGVNREYRRRLKRDFKAAAIEAQKDELIKRMYNQQVDRGVRPEMARLSIARQLAAVTLRVWKSGQEYDENKLSARAA